MYLSDMLVAANKEGGSDCVKQIMRVLARLPSEWWNVRGCRNWLDVAIRQVEENEESFFGKLDQYEEKSWKEEQPFDKEL